MKIVKPASTIMIAREIGDQLEVLLLKRNKALKFAGGLWVFPGGKIDEADKIGISDELDIAKVAAIRETKEEANIDIIREDLTFFSHWTTPVIEPRRFATWFFFAGIKNQQSEVQVDGSEVKKYLWINPQLALDKADKGELGMMPPTYMSMQRIRKCKSIEAARQELSRTAPFFILPVLQFVKGKLVCMYEGDAGYDSGNAATLGARHRLTADMTTGGFVFEYADCAHILPVSGGMHL